MKFNCVSETAVKSYPSTGSTCQVRKSSTSRGVICCYEDLSTSDPTATRKSINLTGENRAYYNKLRDARAKDNLENKKKVVRCKQDWIKYFSTGQFWTKNFCTSDLRTKENKIKEDKTKEDKTKENKVKEGKTTNNKIDKTTQIKAEDDKTYKHKFMVNKTKEDKTMATKGLPHFAEGEVIKGFGRGSKQLGCPTANFPVEVVNALPEEMPTGVYCGFATVNGGPVYKMVMSIGWNPFYKNEKKSMETHIMHKFEDDFYGKTLKIVILDYIRPEKNFGSLDELIQAIKDDIDQADMRLENPEMQKFKSHFIGDSKKS